MDLVYGIALSFHLGMNEDYNNLHPHIRLQNDDFIAGAYYNSEDALSAYAGIELGSGKWNHEFGLVSGYNESTVIPFVRSTYELNDNTIGYISPGFEDNNIGVVLGIEFQIKK